MPYRDEIKRMFALQKFGMKFGLDNMRDILARLGHPEHGLKLVHVAGTNGKGSVTAILASILAEAGFRVGVYTSPHLITFRERIKINGDMISEEDVLKHSKTLWPLFPDPERQPTFFEFVTALAFLYFKEQAVDLAIIETGLGGRLDSTNVITPVACAVTNVSLEHMEYLGDSLKKIAAEKAGIIKPGVPVTLGELEPEAAEVILAAADAAKAPTLSYGESYRTETKGVDEGHVVFDIIAREADGSEYTRLAGVRAPLPGRHQVSNTCVALTLTLLLKHAGFTIGHEAVMAGLKKVDWPGRGQIFAPGAWPPGEMKAKARLMLDGAHNPAGAQALAASLPDFRHEKLHLVLGVMADKDVAGVLKPLMDAADEIYLTRPEFYRAASPELLKERLEAAFGPLTKPHALFPHLPEAIEAAAAKAGPNDLVMISGSLFTVGEALAYLTGAAEVESN